MTDSGEPMNSEAWDKLHPVHQERLKKAVMLLAETHSRKLSPAAITVWCRALAPYAEGKLLWRAFQTACETERMPSIDSLRTLMRGRPELSVFQPPPPLSEAEQKRSDQAAIMSMLWLHYECGWSFHDVSGHVLARCFGGDAHSALVKAAECFDAETVRKWMYTHGDAK
jgi:hypothetical protein